jgi:hypothetical protein
MNGSNSATQRFSGDYKKITVRYKIPRGPSGYPPLKLCLEIWYKYALAETRSTRVVNSPRFPYPQIPLLGSSYRQVNLLRAFVLRSLRMFRCYSGPAI